MDSLSFASVSGAAWGQEELLLVLSEDSLFHGKSIVVRSSGDFENASFETVSEFVSLDFIAQFVVDQLLPESLVLELLFDLCSILWVSDVKYHS
jgi:hypothetical protein